VHVNNVYKVLGRDRKACDHDPANTSGDQAYTTGDQTLFNQCRSNGATAFGTCQALGFTLTDTITDAARRTRAAHPTDLDLFHDAGKLISVTDLAELNGFAGCIGGNESPGLLGSTSLYGPSTLFSVVDTANSADAAYLVGCAGSTNGSGVVGFPNGEGSNWFSIALRPLGSLISMGSAVPMRLPMWIGSEVSMGSLALMNSLLLMVLILAAVLLLVHLLLTMHSICSLVAPCSMSLVVSIHPLVSD